MVVVVLTNTAILGADTTNYNTDYRLLMGAYNDSSGNYGYTSFLQGRVYGAIVRLADIDAVAQVNAENWLAGKCGV